MQDLQKKAVCSPLVSMQGKGQVPALSQHAREVGDINSPLVSDSSEDFRAPVAIIAFDACQDIVPIGPLSSQLIRGVQFEVIACQFELKSMIGRQRLTPLQDRT